MLKQDTLKATGILQQSIMNDWLKKRIFVLKPIMEANNLNRSEVTKAAKIECPRCHSDVFHYVEKDGVKLIVSPCGWELVELEGPADDMDWEETE
jgi:hypothetical protein